MSREEFTESEYQYLVQEMRRIATKQDQSDRVSSSHKTEPRTPWRYTPDYYLKKVPIVIPFHHLLRDKEIHTMTHIHHRIREVTSIESPFHQEIREDEKPITILIHSKMAFEEKDILLLDLQRNLTLSILHEVLIVNHTQIVLHLLNKICILIVLLYILVKRK